MVLFLGISQVSLLLLGSIVIFICTIFILIINIFREIKEGKLEHEIFILLAGLIICFLLPVILGLLNELIK